MPAPDRYHDLGGRLPPDLGDGGPIVRTERTLFHWERQCAAMRVLLGEAGLVPLDELRDTFETFGRTRYDDLSFFGRMLESMTLILQRKSVVDAAALEAAVEALKARWRADPGWLTALLDRSADPCAPAAGQPDPYGGRGYLPVAEAPPADAEWRTIALAGLLEARGVLERAAIRAAIERIDAPEPAWGARIVARAWVDARFERAILEDGRVACDTFGIPFRDGRLVIVPSTAAVHCVIVCTLCSCYPRNLLGQPPAWYVGKPYRTRTVREPRAVLTEFGLRLPDSVRVDVYDSTADLRYMVLPRRPEGTGLLDEAALAALVTRDCLIGVAVPQAPADATGTTGATGATGRPGAEGDPGASVAAWAAP
jgi:nitrile hydratase